MRPVRVLVINAGSSSLKLSLLEVDGGVPDPLPLREQTVQRWSGADDLDPLREFMAGLPGGAAGIDAAAHRVVHGGDRFPGPVVLSPGTVAAIEALTPLAPVHQPRSLAGIRAVSALLPGVPAVAAFDTLFHRSLPEAAATYALPREWNARFGLRRYGFHGLSHAYAARRAADLVDRPVGRLRIITCHLGSGASLAAVRDGRAVDTTMGFTPLAGLVMATRPGSVDPGLLLWLLTEAGIGVAELSEALEHRSGLAGLSGTGGDLRDVSAARDAGDPDAGLALDVYLHRLAREIAALTASTSGMDVLAFTGGVGQNCPQVRAEVAARLSHLGVALDPGRNRRLRPDAELSAPGATVRTVVLAAREDLEIAAAVRALDGTPVAAGRHR